MSAQEGNQVSVIGGASGSAQSVPQICRHRKHYEFTAKRLVYRWVSGCDYVYFAVYSHHRTWNKVRKNKVCEKQPGNWFVELGYPDENGLTLVPPIGFAKGE